MSEEQDQISRAVRLWQWLKKHIAGIVTIVTTGSLGAWSFIGAIKAGYDGIGAISGVMEKLGIPTAILVYLVIYYLPKQESKHQTEMDRSRSVQEKLIESHERREEKSLKAFQDAIERLMENHAELTHEVQSLIERIDPTGPRLRIHPRPRSLSAAGGVKVPPEQEGGGG